MKYEALGGLRKRNGVLERRASCLREGGGAGYPLEAHPERACVPKYGGAGPGDRISIFAFTVNRVAKYMRNGATPEKPMVSGDALRVSSLVPCRAQRVVRDAGWGQACARSFARVFCASRAGTLGH
jgi:hypothetical protein